MRLDQIGVRETALSCFCSYLTGRQIQPRVGDYVSPNLPITSGVPQGSVLGPLLFLIHFQDITAATSATSALFADDALLYRTDCRGATTNPYCQFSNITQIANSASLTKQ